MNLKHFLLPLLVLSCPTLSEDNWRRPSPQDLVLIDTEQGQVIVELTDAIAPNHVAQFKALVKEGFYDNLDFYRVIDGFVAQGGDVSGENASVHKKVLKAELSRAITTDSRFQTVQAPAYFADATGFLNGFPAARDNQDNREWLVHCPSVVAMARGVELNTGSSDFYIVIGQATRHLDRNMSVFGRVLAGMDVVQRFARGDREQGGGVIADADKRTGIRTMTLIADMPEALRPQVWVEATDAESFLTRIENSRTLSNPFFHHKGTGKLDVCYNLPKVKIETPQSPQP